MCMMANTFDILQSLADKLLALITDPPAVWLEALGL